MSGMRLVRVTGKCPHCEVRKHQIDVSEERALEVVGAAIERHVVEAHSELGSETP